MRWVVRFVHGHLAFRHDRNSAADLLLWRCDRNMTTWPFVSIDETLVLMILLRIGTLPPCLTDPPLRPTPVQVVSLGCETIEAPVLVSGIVVALMRMAVVSFLKCYR